MSISSTPRHRSRGPVRSSKRRLSRALVAAVGTLGCLAATIPASSVGASAAVLPTDGRVQIGGIGDVATLSSRTGTTLPVHRYGRLEGSVPEGRMVTADTSARWSQVANASPGTTVYQNIVRWANTIKARPGNTLVAFAHEPELAKNTSFGTDDEFIAAFRRFVTIFRQQGVSNVRFTWQMTGWSFRTSTSNRQYAAKWYPGDAYVDVIGADEYNWYSCGEGQGRWLDLGTMFAPALQFAKSHGKKAAIPEFASHADGRRASWIDNAHQYLSANKATIVAAFYFNRLPTNSANSDCRFALSTSSEYQAFTSMVRDTADFIN